MANKQKHADRSRRSHRQEEATRNSGIYRMASVVDRKVNMRNVRKHQLKGGT